MSTDTNRGNTRPTREAAEQIMQQSCVQNPGPWTDHCRAVARAAEAIAAKCGLDPERAYVSGLLHDIGYSEYRDGIGRTSHILIGYELMLSKGYETTARICLSHSFPYQDLQAYGGSDMNCTDSERDFLATFLSEISYDEYDKLIQLCDCLGTAQGIILMEQRMLDVVIRHGFSEFTIKRWQAFLALKEHFDAICGMNINNLFHEEMSRSIFG